MAYIINEQLSKQVLGMAFSVHNILGPGLLESAYEGAFCVEPARSGFVLRGFGADSAEYRLDLHLDMPVDPKTQTVLGGILSQSEWRIWRRAPRQLRTRPTGRTPSPAR